MLVTALAACALACLVSTQPAHAQGLALTTQEAYTTDASWRLSKSSLTIKRYNTPARIALKGKDVGSSRQYTVTSSNDAVASVNGMYYDSGTLYFTVKKERVGKAVITVEDYYTGEKRTLTVACKPTNFKFYQNGFTFSKKTRYWSTWTISPSWMDDHAPDSVIKKVKSSNKAVASAAIRKSNGNVYLQVTPKGAGTAKITVTDQYKRTKTVKVKVAKGYFKANLATSSAYAHYGSKRVQINTKPGARVTLKIKNEKHTTKADKNGNARIELKNTYRKGVKFTVSFKTSKASYTKKFSVGSNS